MYNLQEPSIGVSDSLLTPRKLGLLKIVDGLATVFPADDINDLPLPTQRKYKAMLTSYVFILQCN